MRKVFFGLLAAFLALGACAAIPSSAQGWYTPANGFEHTKSRGYVYYYDEYGYSDYAGIDVDENGNVSGEFDMDEDSPAYPAYMALIKALKAETIAQQNKERIEEIGNNLDSVFRTDGIQMEMEKQGPGGSSRPVTYTMRIKPGSNGGPATIEAEDPTPYGRIVDDKTIAWTAENETGQLMINGALTATSSNDDIWDGRGFVVPFLEGNAALGWKRFGGVDKLVFEKRADGGGNWELTLKNFHFSDTSGSDSLSELLTDESKASTRANYHIVGRYGSGDGATLHYLPIGDIISAIGTTPDDVTMTTNTEYGAEFADVLSLYGWRTSYGVDSLADFLTVDMGADGDDMPTYEVLARYTDGDYVSLEYLSLGNLHGVTWATNWTEAIKGIAADEAERIVNWNTNWVVLAGDIASSEDKMREYVDNTLNWSTNWFASTQDMNASADSIRQYIDGQLDIITNQIAGINGVIASENTNIQTVNQYIQTVLAMQTNFITGVEMAQLNGTVESMKDYIDETFDILTNQIVGIKGVIESGDVQTVNTVAEYIQEVINLQTNFITDAQFAQLNGTVESTKELVDYYFDILTNQIVGIKGVIESGDFTDLQTVGDYVQKEIGIQTNEMVAIMTALDNGVAESVTELVEYKYDILTNEIAGIMGVIESDVVTVDSVGDYIKKVINIQTNVIVHEAFVTNFINTFEMVENWTYVTNYIVRYLGVTDSGGGHGGEEEGPAIAPEDDPYSGEYEPQEIDDFLLPVKNARNIVSITNEPLSEIESTHLLDFMSIDTNKEHLVQLKGFDEADEESIPVKRRGATANEYKLEWMSSPTDLLQITTNGIAEIREWVVRNNVTNILKSVINNSEAVNTMRTNLFAHVKAETMLDNDSVWTNGQRRVEIKGYGEASLFSVPFVDINSELYMSGKEKGLLWERMPFADSDANDRTGNASISRTIEANLEKSVLEGEDEIKALSLYGFSNASDGQIPMKSGSVEPGGPESIVWVDPMNGDNVSLTTNENSGATADGVLSIYGYRTALAGTVLRRTSDGVEWAALGGAGADDASITTNANNGAVAMGQLSIYGFDDAEENMMPHKEGGKIVWGGASATTNTILAGAGINITDNGGGAITISAQAMEDDSGGNVCTVTVITDARYDETSHKFQVKKRTLTFTGSMTAETNWQDVFEAVSHKAEHEGGTVE